MAETPKRPSVRIRFRFDVETGETEFIIDDDAPDRSDAYHDKVAEAIAAYLRRHPEIEDAGPIRHRIERAWRERTVERKREERKDDPETLNQA